MKEIPLDPLEISSTQLSIHVDPEDGSKQENTKPTILQDRPVHQVPSVHRSLIWLVLAIAIALAMSATAVCISAFIVLSGRISDLDNRDQDIRLGTILVSSSATSPSGFERLATLNNGEGEWSPGVHMPSTRSDFHAVFCDGRIFVMGGVDLAGSVSNDVWAFEPVEERWSTVELASMPTGRYRYGAACLEGIIYVAGGYDSVASGDAGECLDTVDVYDVDTNLWSPAASLPRARGDLALVAHLPTGRLYALGGYGFQYPYPDPGMAETDVYDPATDTWTIKAPLPGGGKGDISAVAIDGKLYVPGGWNGVFLDQLAVYDIDADEWSLATPMIAPRGDKAVVAMDGKLLVFGGETWSGKRQPCPWDITTMCDINQVPVYACERYDPRDDTWESIAPLPEARFRFAAASAGGVMYAFGGHAHDEVATNSVWAFHYAKQPNVFFHFPVATIAA